VHKSRKVAFVYLANDLIQKSILKRQKNTLQLDYQEGFENVIPEALTSLFEVCKEPEVFNPIVKVLQVWSARKVYDSSRIDELAQNLAPKQETPGLSLPPGTEIPPVYLELATAMQTLKSHKSESEADYILAKAYL